MAKGFSIIGQLNENSKKGLDEKPKATFWTKDIDIYNIYENEMNGYRREGLTEERIEQKAEEIKLLGLLQPLEVKYEPNGQQEYKLIGGEQRWRALKKLVDTGNEEFRMATCQIRNPKSRNEEIIELCISNSYKSKTQNEKLKETEMLMEALKDAKAKGEKIMGHDLQSGKLRDIAAKIVGKKPTQIANMMNINNNLIDEFKELVENRQINMSVAAEIAGMDIDKQREVLEVFLKNGNITVSKVREFKQEKENETDGIEQETNNIEKSEQRENFGKKQKETEESGKREEGQQEQSVRHEIKQKENKQPEVQEDNKEKVHYLNTGVTEGKEIEIELKTFLLVKNDRNFKTGDKVVLRLRNAGKFIEKELERKIVYVEKEHAGLAEEWCVLGLK